MNRREPRLLYAVEPQAEADETPAPEAASTTEVDPEAEAQEAAWQRACQFSYDSLVMQYGFLPDEHPAQQDLNSIFNRLGPEAKKYVKRLVILPQMREINAMASPDGTVFISAALMQFCDSEEELAGVIAHEIIHIKEQDARHRQAISKKDQDDDSEASFREIVSQILRGTSISRLHEYRADAEGVILFLDKAGINPLGYKHLLEKLHMRQVRGYGYRPDTAHGTSIDRALGIGLMARFHDMTSLTSEMTMLDSGRKKSWQSQAATAPVSRFHLFRSVRFETDPDGCHRRRLAAIDEMTITECHLAYRELFTYWHSGLSEAEQKLQEQIEKKLVARIEQDIGSWGIAEQPADDSTIKFFHYSLNLGINASSRKLESGSQEPVGNKEQRRLEKSFKDQISTLSGMARAREILTRMAVVPMPYALGSPFNIIDMVSEAYIEKKLFGPLVKDQFGFTDWHADVTAWASCLEQFNNQRGVAFIPSLRLQQAAFDMLVTHTEDDSDFQEQAETFASANNLKPKRKTVKEKQRREYSAIEQDIAADRALDSKIERVVLEARTSRYERKHNILDLDAAQRWWGSIKRYILEKIAGKSRKEAGTILSAIRQRLNDVITDKHRGRLDIATRLETDALLGSPSEYDIGHLCMLSSFVNVSILSVYSQVVAEHPAFAGMTKWERQTAVSIARTAWCEERHEEEDTSMLFDDEKQRREWYKLGRQLAPRQIAWYYKALHEDEFALHSVKALDEKHSELRLYLIDIVSYRMSLLPVAGWGKYLDDLEALGVPVRNMLGDHRDRLGHLVEKATRQLGEVQEKWQEFEILEILESIVNDAYLRVLVQKRILEERWEQNPGFEGHLTIAFNPDAGVGSLESKDRLIEEDMETEGQVVAVRERIRSITDDVMASGSETIGWSIAAEKLGLGKDPVASLDALLSTRASEKQLKTAVFRLAEAREVADEDTQAELEESFLTLERKLAEVQKLLNTAYSFSREVKLYIVKKLLVDSQVMQKPQERRRVLTALLERTVGSRKGQEDLRRLMADTAQAAAEVRDWELLFYSLSPTLADSLLVPPAQPTTWEEIARQQHAYEFAERDSVRRIGRLPEAAKHAPWEHTGAYLIAGEGELRKKLIQEEEEALTAGEMYSPLELIVDIAQRAGSFGVRFLQLLPQFLKVPADYEKSFNRLYDKVRGQSKLTAVSVMEREWPDMWQHVERVGRRLGGGSLMTVYEVTMKTGEKRAVRVRNPNIVYHLEMTRDFIRSVIAEMSKRRKLAPETAAQLEIVIGFVDEWIRRDMDFEGFLANDARFREANNGYTREGLARSIYVPKSEGPTSNYFQVEELVEGGHNLTEWDELVQEGHDMKEVVALIVSNAMHQLEAGQLHGDVHIGNYRVMPDGNVAILDRTFYLDLDDDEKAIVSGLLKGNIEIPRIMAYIGKLLPPDKSRNLPQVMRSLTTLGGQFAGGDFVGVNRSLVEMRQAGVQVPLKITLLLRNINNLRLLSIKAGFVSLQAASSYKVASK